MKKYRVIAAVRVKNEAWILETWLKRTCEYVDGIIAINDASTDESVKILRSCPKTLVVVDNPPGGIWNQFRDRNRLFDEARHHEAEWVHVIDPDEIMDTRLAGRIGELTSRKTVGRYFFKEVTLWRSTKQYRIDSPEKYHRSDGTNQLLRLTPELRWVVPAAYDWKRRLITFLKTGRIPPVPKAGWESLIGIQGKTVCLDDLVRLHYHFVDWNHTWFVHLRYAAREAIQMRKRLEELNELVSWSVGRMDESGLQLAAVKTDWGVLDINLDSRFIVSNYI